MCFSMTEFQECGLPSQLLPQIDAKDLGWCAGCVADLGDTLPSDSLINRYL